MEKELERRLRRLLSGWPDNPVREGRGSRPQMEIAFKSGLTQAHLSELENRRRELTPSVAARLGPVLGMDGDQLMAAEIMAGLKEMASERPREIDPHLIVELVDFLDRALADTEFADELTTVLLELAEARIGAYRKAREKGPASLKAKAREGTRDPFGRRRRKPWGPGDLR